MVYLHMIGDDIVNLSRVNYLLNSLKHLLEKGSLDRIHQSYFLINDKIRVIGSPSRGMVTMKITKLPIYSSYPVNSFS